MIKVNCISKGVFLIFALCFTTMYSQVGINTETPTATLHVNGNTKVSEIETIGSHSDLDSIGVYGNEGELKKVELATLSEKIADKKIRIFATKGNGQPIPNGTSTKITNWTTTQIENAGTSWNATTGEFTVPISGWYRVSTTLTYEMANVVAGFEYNVQVRKNSVGPPVGSLPHFTEANTIGNIAINTGLLTSIVKCNAGDVLSVFTYQNQGSTRSLIVTGNKSLCTVIIEQI